MNAFNNQSAGQRIRGLDEPGVRGAGRRHRVVDTLGSSFASEALVQLQPAGHGALFMTPVPPLTVADVVFVVTQDSSRQRPFITRYGSPVPIDPELPVLVQAVPRSSGVSYFGGAGAALGALSQVSQLNSAIQTFRFLFTDTPVILGHGEILGDSVREQSFATGAFVANEYKSIFDLEDVSAIVGPCYLELVATGGAPTTRGASITLPTEIIVYTDDIPRVLLAPCDGVLHARIPLELMKRSVVPSASGNTKVLAYNPTGAVAKDQIRGTLRIVRGTCKEDHWYTGLEALRTNNDVNFNTIYGLTRPRGVTRYAFQLVNGASIGAASLSAEYVVPSVSPGGPTSGGTSPGSAAAGASNFVEWQIWAEHIVMGARYTGAPTGPSLRTHVCPI